MNDNVVDLTGVSKDGIMNKEALLDDLKGANASGKTDIYFKNYKHINQIKII